MTVRFGIIAALVISAGACATAPTYTDVQRSRVIDQPFDQTWDNVVEFFATNSIAIRNIDKDSGLLVAEQQYVGYVSPTFDAWASCGRPGFPEVTESRSVNLNVLARPDAQGTRMTVTAVFRQHRTTGEFGSRTVECQSTGALEQLIFSRAIGD